MNNFNEKFKNMSIKKKLLLSFGTIIVSTFILIIALYVIGYPRLIPVNIPLSVMTSLYVIVGFAEFKEVLKKIKNNYQYNQKLNL